MIAKCKIALKEYNEAMEWLHKACDSKQSDTSVSFLISFSLRSL